MSYQPYDPTATYSSPSQHDPGYMPPRVADLRAQPPVPYPDMPYPTVPAGVRPEHPQSTVILVLGILSFVCGLILGPVAWGLGNKAKRECEAGLYRLTDPLRIGRVLGMVATILLIVVVALIIIGVIAFVSLGVITIR